MIWIIGLLLFLLEFYVLKHTVWFRKYASSSYGCIGRATKPEPVTIKLWHILALAAGNIGYLCCITLLLFIVLYIKKAVDDGFGTYNNTYWRLQIGWVQKLGKLLSMPI